MSNLLDKNHAECVFSFIFSYAFFSYTEDEQIDGEFVFQDIVRSIFGLRLPEELNNRLKPIFKRVQENKTAYEEVMNSFIENFKGNKEILVPTFQLLLKFSSEDGMLSQHDRARLKTFISKCNLNDEDLLQLTEEEKIILKTLILDFKTEIKSTNKTISEMYKILECSPQDKDDEIKRNYYALAKKFHPDTAKKKNDSESFQKIQKAYETIISIRKNMIRKNKTEKSNATSF